MEKFPTQLATQLPLRTRDALGHPVRREILRTLNCSAKPRSSSEIATTLAQANVSVISYHAQVLEGCGSIAVSAVRQVPDGLARLYVSTVTDDEQVASVLQITRQADRWVGEIQ